MENSSIDLNTTITTPPNQFPISPLTHQQHQYPAHHPTQLPDQLLAVISRPEAVVLLLEITNCNSSDIPTPTTTLQPALGQLVVPMAENEQYHSTAIEFESPDSQIEQPVTTLSTIQHSDHDSSILTERSEAIEVSIGDEDQSMDLRLTESGTRLASTDFMWWCPLGAITGALSLAGWLRDCSDPKGVSYLLRVYPIFMGLVAGKSLWEKHTPFPITNPFMIISILTYAMAYVNLLILSFIYDGLSRQTFSPAHYRISKCIFYIMCFLAPFSLLPLLFIPMN